MLAIFLIFLLFPSMPFGIGIPKTNPCFNYKDAVDVPFEELDGLWVQTAVGLDAGESVYFKCAREFYYDNPEDRTKGTALKSAIPLKATNEEYLNWTLHMIKVPGMPTVFQYTIETDDKPKKVYFVILEFSKDEYFSASRCPDKADSHEQYFVFTRNIANSSVDANDLYMKAVKQGVNKELSIHPIEQNGCPEDTNDK